ncbi:hypothetical protein Cgig2_030612 [Carnegiea gigantea]|uniref:CBS domain-containing protein n=1 Tax=Carnegiea gigantea TaxID=171969 RepID=A0A9Q1K7S1_9CARY|nr:hypothetical protein Cgig2_030612 [Carnegiea gigantea]
MALTLLDHVVADLCLGKPALKSLSLSSATSVGDALSAIKASQDNFITIWACHCRKYPRKLSGGDALINYQNISTSTTNDDDDNNNNNNSNGKSVNGSEGNGEFCECLGKICMVDIICFLCKEENLGSPASALLSPVSDVLNQASGFVKHVDPSTSLVEAIDLILQGAQNLVVPIQTSSSPYSRRKAGSGPTFHNGREYCWLTQEDVIQFILSRIGLFTPIPNLSIETLGIIRTEILTVDYHAPASLALDAIARALAEQTSVGVVDEDGTLVGEISPFTLCGCDETVAAAIMTLSAGDLMAYIDWGGPPEDMVRVMKARLVESKLEGLLDMLSDDYSSYSSVSSSSDDESMPLSSPTSRLARHNRSWSYSARMVRKAEAIVCHPRSSLVAVMIQAIAHRVNYVWVMEDDYTLIGIVTFSDMLEVFHEHLQSMLEEWGTP